MIEYLVYLAFGVVLASDKEIRDDFSFCGHYRFENFEVFGEANCKPNVVARFPSLDKV